MSAPPLAAPLLAPRSVALIGASADPGKTTARVQRYLRKHGFTGALWPINPKHREIFGEPALPSISAVPEPVDHAFILVAAEAVPGVVAECGEMGVRCATILADGFAEEGAEGSALQARVLEAARAHGVRLLGPNSMGLINLTDGVALSVNAALDAPAFVPGNLGVLSHSGNLLGTLLSRGHARGIGFSKLVSVGNEADLDIAELGEMLIDDDATHAILLFLETIRAPRRTEAMARRAAAAGKPVIAYMLGRSDAGRELSASHTGALVGSDEAAGAFLSDCGIIRVDMLEALFEAPPLVIGRRAPEARPRAVAVMTTTGGAGAMVVDRLALAGVEVAPPPADVIEALAGRGIRIGPGRLVDMTLLGARPEIVGAVLEALLASPHCDLVVVVAGSSAQFQPDLVVQPIIANAGAGKPVAAFLAPQADESLARLAAAGIAAFRTPEACADAVRAYFDWRPPREFDRPPVGDPGEAARRLAGAAPDVRGALAVFEALGVPSAESHVIEDLDGLGDADVRGLYPAAAKVLSPDIAHKTEAGGVALGIADEAALREACRRILDAVAAAAPGARRSGILVQRMETGSAEALVGYRVDPQVGPIVALGSGGTLTEIARDAVVRRAPVSLADAHAMIDEVRGLVTLCGYRGAPAGDRDALARAICAVSDFAALPGPGVREAEINPLIVRAEGEGVVAVDALIVPAAEGG